MGLQPEDQILPSPIGRLGRKANPLGFPALRELFRTSAQPVHSGVRGRWRIIPFQQADRRSPRRIASASGDKANPDASGPPPGRSVFNAGKRRLSRVMLAGRSARKTALMNPDSARNPSSLAISTDSIYGGVTWNAVQPERFGRGPDCRSARKAGRCGRPFVFRAISQSSVALPTNGTAIHQFLAQSPIGE